MMRNLLAWNSPYPTLELFGGQLPTRSIGIADLSISLSPFAGLDVSVNPGFDFFAMPMPQAGSSKIVFTSNRYGNAQIYSMNVDGSGLIRLSANAYNDDHPRWSPNGTKILFQSDRNNPETGNADIYVMNANGTSQTRLTYDAADDRAAVWSPDGSKIVFQSLRNGQYYQVYVMNADGTNQVNVSNGIAADYQPSWSPDGSKIAFASERDSPTNLSLSYIYVMNANGSTQTRLTFGSEPFRDEQPAWSRDASRIAFVSTRDSVVVTWQETDDEGGILNRSSVRTNKEVYKMNADGSNQVRLTNTLENDDSPYWSPDGTQIIFRSDRERDLYDPTQQLWMMSAAGSNQTLLAGNAFGDYSPSWNTSAANQSPTANPGGPYSGLTAQNVQFNASSSFDSDGTITSYLWSFGDGTSASVVAPAHAFASAGAYTVTLTVTDNLGAQSSANTSATISTAGSEQYLVNFSQAALARAPYANESSYWNDILRAAFSNGQNSMLLAVRELGKTLFESSEYAARGRNNHWYVYDLYKTYLMREPDAPGWTFWENVCNSYGRDNVRRAFDESGEFNSIVATLTPVGSPSSAASSFASARVDPFNQPGNGLTSRDAEWSVPLLSLPGRAGLDLGLSLSYSSMVWTRSGPYIYFDEDNGWPSPGFRLGFPAIQEKFFDAQAGDNVYLLISGGSRVSLRQLGTSNVYEAADSSYLQLIDSGGSLLVRSTDGTQLTYQPFNDEWRCTQIKDRNGNYITVDYDWRGQITTIVDTLGRTITFDYDSNANLQKIKQSWAGQPLPHEWVTFGWATKTLQPSFSGVMVVGATNGTTIPVLSQVGFDDATYCKFLYNSAGLVERITHYASDSNPATDSHPRNYTAYDYQSTTDDCPRLSGTRTWAENWTGVNGVPSEVVRQYGVEGNAHTLTVVGDPNSTLYKEFYGTGWQRGLTTQTEVWSAGVKQKWTSNTWTQDNTGINYQTNPRVTETNTHDGSNHRRVTTTYATSTLPSGASCSLPSDIREYADASTILRHTHMDYRMDPILDAVYLDRRIIGLAKEQSLFEVNGGSETLMAKVGLSYDETGSVQGTDAPVRHDNSYDGNFVTGRANLSSVKRYDVTVTDNSQFTTSTMKYNTSGSVVSTTDPIPQHTTTISYGDSFSDGNNNRNTLAYATTVTDADGYSSINTYHFDFGAVTRKQTPQPNQTANILGLEQTFDYDAAGRIEKSTSTTNGAYVRYVYGPNYFLTRSTVNNVADEGYSNVIFDGVGRTVVAASNHPGSEGGYSAQHTIYDLMGRAVKQSNPTETNGAWAPAGDDAGWLYTQQTYDWKGRPLITTNPDTTTKEASYSGCGCAGGEVVTLTDEGTVVSGVSKKRQQKIYSDVVGRTVKTEVLNWDGQGSFGTGGTPYLVTVNSYNARDQITRVRQFDAAQATVPSDPNDLSCPDGACQQTTMTHDGYGRLKTKHVAEQDADTATTWDYNADETIQQVTDARGVSKTLTYNGRHLLTSITYPQNLPSGVAVASNVSYEYDAAGNRTSMTDGLGSMSYSYDQLSRLTSETRTINGVGTYPLSYAYNLANQLTRITDPFNTQVDYNFDTAGRATSVTGPGFTGDSSYARNIKYRAWGGQKSVTYGDNKSATTSYDVRMRPSAYDFPGLREQFQYYDDGRLKQMTDLDDRNQDIGYPDTARHFSRARSYDQLARLTSDKGATSNTFPLNQNYAYDAFNNLTSRYGTYYYQAQTSDSATFTNNRRQNWTYHADGQVKHSPLAFDSNFNESIYRDWTYDADGRMVQVQETITNPSSTSTYSTSYDGDGQSVRESTITAAYNTTGYMIRSSVLRGQVVTRLDSAGAKQKTTVNVDGRLVVVHLSVSGSSSISWTHVDPLGLSEAGDTKPVYDALGNYIPWQHVPTAPPNAYPPHSPNHGGLGSLFGSSQDKSCTFNGLPISCSDLAHQIDIGNASALWVRWGGRTQELPIEPFGLGMYTAWVEDDGSKLGEAGPDPDVVRTNIDQDGLGHYEFFLISVAPQNLGIKALLNAKDAKRYAQERMGALGRLAFSPNCRKFLADHGIDVKALIDAVRNQRPFDGTKSTITRLAAGVVFMGNPIDVRMGYLPIKADFNSRGGTNAETGVFPGGPLGSTVLDRSDVYFRRAGINTATILHEALHSLLGETDPQLQDRFGLSTAGLSNNITQELRKHDCAE